MSSKQPFLYISGPMRGHKDMNRPAFMEAERRLKGAGYRVYNPAVADVEMPLGRKARFADYLERDLRAIAQEGCMGSALMDGWKDSDGARIETCVVDILGKQPRPVEVWENLDPEGSVSPLLEAQKLVFGARHQSYGHPADDFGRTAQIWSAILGHPVTAAQVGLCMIGVKLSREVHRPKRDNLVDIAGYAATVQRVKDREGA